MQRMISRMERIFSTLKVIPELVPTSREELKDDLYSDVRSPQPLAAVVHGALALPGHGGTLGVRCQNGKIQRPPLNSDEVE